MGELDRGPSEESEGLREPGLSGPPGGYQDAGEVRGGHLLQDLGDYGKGGKGVSLETVPCHGQGVRVLGPRVGKRRDEPRELVI